MEIRLGLELEALVASDMASGRYVSIEEYVAEAVVMLHERQQWRAKTLEELNSSLEASIAEAERGDVLDEAGVRREMREMKADWLKMHPLS